MKPSSSPPGEHRLSMMTLQRLQQLLDAYGAAPERWPEAEHDAALLLLAHSPAARAQREEAAYLDALLDLASGAHPSAELVPRILAAVSAETIPAQHSGTGPAQGHRSGYHQPRAARRHGTRAQSHWMWRWPTLAAAASLAIVLWGVQTWAPSRHGLPPDAIANLGVYTMPTDVLLEWPGVTMLNTLPSVGCVDDELACPTLNISPDLESQSPAKERNFV